MKHVIDRYVIDRNAINGFPLGLTFSSTTYLTP